jgi:hypothetical protein
MRYFPGPRPGVSTRLGRPELEPGRWVECWPCTKPLSIAPLRLSAPCRRLPDGAITVRLQVPMGRLVATGHPSAIDHFSWRASAAVVDARAVQVGVELPDSAAVHKLEQKSQKLKWQSGQAHSRQESVVSSANSCMLIPKWENASKISDSVKVFIRGL